MAIGLPCHRNPLTRYGWQQPRHMRVRTWKASRKDVGMNCHQQHSGAEVPWVGVFTGAGEAQSLPQCFQIHGCPAFSRKACVEKAGHLWQLSRALGSGEAENPCFQSWNTLLLFHPPFWCVQCGGMLSYVQLLRIDLDSRTVLYHLFHNIYYLFSWSFFSQSQFSLPAKTRLDLSKIQIIQIPGKVPFMLQHLVMLCQMFSFWLKSLTSMSCRKRVRVARNMCRAL